MLRRLVVLFVVLASAVTTSAIAVGVSDKVLPSCDEGHVCEVTSKTDATCTEDGVVVEQCSECGEEQKTTVPALGHNLATVPGSAQEPNCEEDGYTGDVECIRSGCSYVEEGEVIPAEGHDYEKIVTAPTCEAKGYTTYTCDCGDSYVGDEVAALGHAYGEWTSVGDGTHKKVCANDGAHVVVEDCSGGTATCEQKAECTVCGGEYGELASHVFDQEVVDDAYLKSVANCTYAAVYYKSCECGHFDASLSETFSYGSTADHVYDREVAESDYLAAEATCTEAAKYYKTCVCGLKSTETFSYGDALGHRDTEDTISAKAATCEEDGCTVGTYCHDCDTFIVESETIPALGHDYEAVVTAPTCDDAGYTTYTCKNDATHTYVGDEVAALGHDYEAVVTAPTCDDAGYTTYTCKNDATHTYVGDEVAALGHDYEAVVTAPTCDDAGYTTYTCKNDATHTYVGDEVAALGHSFIEGVGICSTCGVNKAEISFVTNAQGYTNAQDISEVEIDGVKFIFAKGTNTSDSPKYYNTGSAIRIYAGNTLTINGAGIEKIVFTFGSGDKTNEITANVGSFATDTWTGLSNEVVFTIGGTSGHRRIASITIFCEKEATCETCTSTSFGSNDTYHWSVCDVCAIKYAPVQHDCDVQNTADEYLATEATCTAKATYYYSCECGYKSSNTFEYGSTLDHAMTHYAAVAATCSATGNVEYWACSSCGLNYDAEQNGNVINNVVLEKDEDNHVDTTVTTAAKESTCTEEGNTATVHCNDCDTDIETSTTIGKKEHSMTYHEAVAATCSATGNVEYWACSSCGLNYDVAQNGNVILNVTIDTLDCVDEDGDNVCDNCGETLCDNHNPTNWTEVDENTHIGTCEACGKTTTAGHGFDAGVVTAPDCENDGYTTYTCTDCGHSYTANPTTATGHSEGAATQENVVASTCTVAGSYESVVKCSDCGEELSRETKALELADHTMTHYEAVASTCSATGNVEYWACSVCGKNYDAEQNGNVIENVTTAINGEAHKWNNGETTTPATCTEAGVMTYTCQLNGEHTKTEAISAKGHTIVNGACACGAIEGTLSFETTDSRVSLSTEQQIWKQGGITLTHNKESSTTNIADYSNPIRFYKSSALIIKAGGMSKIVFNCNTADYATALQNSIASEDGVLVTLSDKAVIVEFASSVNSFTIAALSAQVRMDSITVTYIPCSHTNTETLEAVAATCKATGLTEGEKCSDCGEVLTAQVETPKADHKYVDGTCSVCGDTESAVAEPVTVSMSSFSATSGNVGEDSNVTYTTAKGDGTSNPLVSGNQIRLYQNSAGTGGGTITISAVEGYKIQSITIGSGMSTSIAYTIDASTTKSATSALASGGTYEVTEINASSITFYCMGTDKNTRLYVNYLSVTYVEA